MPTSTYARITLVLPVPSEPFHHTFLNQVIGELIDRCGGATINRNYTGVWIGDDDTREDADRIFVFADADIEPNDPDLLLFLDSLKLRCQQRFSELIIWMTVHRVERITTHDREMY